MNGIMNKNQLTIVKECDSDKPLIEKIDFEIDICITDCHIKYFHPFEYEFVYDKKLTDIGNSEIVNLTIVDKSMSLYESKKNKTCLIK